MTAFSPSLTDRTVLLPQSRDSSHHVSSGQVSTYLPPLRKADRTGYVVSRKWLVGILLIFSLRLALKDLKNTAPPPLRWLKHTDLGLLNVGMPEAGDVVRSLEPYMY